jgi:hypothetical protein
VFGTLVGSMGGFVGKDWGGTVGGVTAIQILKSETMSTDRH